MPLEKITFRGTRAISWARVVSHMVATSHFLLVFSSEANVNVSNGADKAPVDLFKKIHSRRGTPVHNVLSPHWSLY